jgi:hypothetical protein
MRCCRLLACLLIALLPAGALHAQQAKDRQLVDSLLRVADSLNRHVPPVFLNLDRPIADSVMQLADTLRFDSTQAQPADTTRRPEDSLRSIGQAAPAKPRGSGYVLTGIVRDKASGEGVPFANVFFPGTDLGMPADIDGRFSLAFDKPPADSLRITAIGYRSITRRFRPGGPLHRDIEIELEREVTGLNEFVFHAGEDPALALLRQIIAHKPANNPDRLNNYRYQVYNKLEVDLRNLTRKQFESLPVPMIKKFGFIYNNLDSTSEQTPFLPFFLTETLSDYYYQRNPKKTREFIRAINIKGIKNESIDQFLGSAYQNVNAYDNFIPVFDKNFPSPISDNGAFYYRYRIKDTQSAYGHPIVLVNFRPRREGENCFFGDFWVVLDSIYAIQRISMEVPKSANINFVSRVSLYQETAPVADSIWFTVKEKFVADFNLPYSPKLPGFIGRKTTHYSEVAADKDSIAHLLDNPDYKRDVIVADDARLRKDSFWETARPEALSKNELAVYTMIDTLNSLPVFQRFKRLVKLVGGGIYSVGAFDIGPYWNLYSHNQVEGHRFRLGIATNKKLWPDLRLSGYAAYGTDDRALKYFGDAFWLFNRTPRAYLYGSYRHDLDRSNSYYDNSVGPDNIFSGIIRKSDVPYKLALVNDARFEFFKEYFNGFSHMLTLQHRSFLPYAPLPYKDIFIDENGRQQDEVISSEVGLRLRYAWKEKFVESNYFRRSLGSGYPIVELRASMGLKDVLNSGYEYQKASISISDNVKISPLGEVYYNVFAGKTFGTLPYPLLDIAPGNEYYYYLRNAFNMMTRYEFISDQYAGFNFEHNIGSGLFGYIPLLRKAKLRQFWTAKGIVGSLSDENRARNIKPGGYEFRSFDGHPYIEVGTGVSNILQLFRIDFVWRLTPPLLPSEESSRYFGIFGSVRVDFCGSREHRFS